MRNLGFEHLVLPMLVLLSQSAAADVVRHTKIPEPLHGTWAVSEADCGDENKKGIVLAAATYESSEQKCTVLWVTETATPRGPLFSAHLQCSAANGSAKSISNVLLRSSGANQISAGTDFENVKNYQRCPAATTGAR
jgi:hypothetical protein